MNITINSDFNFSVKSIQYTPNGQLQITLTSLENQSDIFISTLPTLAMGKPRKNQPSAYCNMPRILQRPPTSKPRPGTVTALRPL